MNKEVIKIKAQLDPRVQLKVIPGHFATSQSHITNYMDITTMKTRCSEAHGVASVLSTRYEITTPVDTIVCLDGTEVIGTYLAEELTKSGISPPPTARSTWCLRNTALRDRSSSGTIFRLRSAGNISSSAGECIT